MAIWINLTTMDEPIQSNHTKYYDWNTLEWLHMSINRRVQILSVIQKIKADKIFEVAPFFIIHL